MICLDLTKVWCNSSSVQIFWFSQHWTLIAPFVWTHMMVQGSLSYPFSVLRRILSFCTSTLSPMCNPSWHLSCFHILSCNQFDITYSPLFCSSWLWKVCQIECLNKKLYPVRLLVPRAKGPCGIYEKISYVTFPDCVGNVNFISVEHPHDCLMHMLMYCICLWVLDTGWLMLWLIWVSTGREVKHKFTSILLKNIEYMGNNKTKSC